MSGNEARLVHLVGSVPLSDAEAVFRSVAGAIGPHLHGIPDGETGDRLGWIGWQAEVFMRNPELALEGGADPDRVLGLAKRGGEPAATTSREVEYRTLPRFRLRPAHGPVRFGRLGYAEAALESYGLFSGLKSEGVVPAHARFQVSLPTPLAPLSFIEPADQGAVAPAYQAAFRAELEEIVGGIPHDQLGIQWDVAIEVALWEGAFGAPAASEDFRAELSSQLVALGNGVPEAVNLGYHLCYGDYGHRHFKEPADLGTLVEMANRVTGGLRRPLQWMHMPVPRDRSDDPYFAPLDGLRLPAGCQLYLGLIHLGDGIEGARARLAAAGRRASGFGVATECGFGRRPPETVPELLRLHAEVARALSY